MSTIQPKDRVSLCTFTFSDGRRCRTPRQSGHPHYCCFHARKHAQSHAADQLGKDFTFLLSGDHISACDLAAALSRLFAAVASGVVKPRTASTLAYLAQTLLVTIQIAEKEYEDAFGPETLRKVVRTHIRENQEYLRKGSAQPAAQPGNADLPIGASTPPPKPAPQPPQEFELKLTDEAPQPTPASNPANQPLASPRPVAQALHPVPVSNSTPQPPKGSAPPLAGQAPQPASPPAPGAAVTPLKSTLPKVIENK